MSKDLRYYFGCGCCKKKVKGPYPEVALNDPAANSTRGFSPNIYKTTKYTIWNFVFKNIYEQFRRFTNIYFLAVVVITLIPAISPITPITSIVPLIFVLTVAAVREAFEDFARYRADKEVNNRKYQVILGPDSHSKFQLATYKSKHLRVGDLLYITKDQMFPCDVVVLRTARDDGLCFVETSQLDGETNLKIHRAVPITMSMTEDQLVSLRGAVGAEPPNKHFTFKGSLRLEGGTNAVPLDYENLLVRGAQLRNTQWVIGAVTYCGRDTKLVHNQRAPPSKFSQLDKKLNIAVICIFAFNFGCLIMLTLLSYAFERNIPDHWYIRRDPKSSVIVWAIKIFFGYFALLSYLIPQSMMVTLEVTKVLQGQFMTWDENLALDKTNVKRTGMTVKTADLNDELGRVQYIFSDKTGTLTENRMEFNMCSINGVCYEEPFQQIPEVFAQNTNQTHAVAEFLTNIVTCHTIQPEYNEQAKEVIYNAQSPDEEALCKAARKMGFEVLTRVANTVTVKILGREVRFEILATLKFSNERARMSVIVRLPDGGIKLYCKGADTRVFQVLASDNDQHLLEVTHQHLGQFSKKGLRTLAIAFKDLTEDEFKAFNAEYSRAAISLSADKDKDLEAIAVKWESQLYLIGCTAVEDRLQEQVPETIAYMMAAGIKVWVITGDKEETAINIGYSCQLLKQDMTVWILRADHKEACLEQLNSHWNAYRDNPAKSADYAMVINGSTLKFAVELYPGEFLRLASVCHSVVCCRVTPLQKAEVVRLVKERQQAICLAIGDGANDVAMIQAAQIGVGIYGKEGSQAARSADYAIRLFKHLRRLVSVHGRYSLLRNALLVQYSFYKGAAVFLSLVWYAFWSGFSASVMYDAWQMTMFNISVTSLPPLLVGLFERDIPERLIQFYPQVYRRVQTGYLFTFYTLAVWWSEAIFHSLVFFFGGSLLIDGNGTLKGNGQTTDMVLYGNFIMSAAVVTVLVKIAIEINYWTIFHVIGLLISFFSFWVVLAIENVLIPSQAGILSRMFSTPAYWFFIGICPLICVLPDVVYKYLRRTYSPEDWQILQEMEILDQLPSVGDKLRSKSQARKSGGFGGFGSFGASSSSTKGFGYHKQEDF